MSHRSRRSTLRGVFCVSLLAVLSIVSAGAAQASTLPTVSIAITSSSATISGALESGAVNVVTTNAGAKEVAPILFLLKPSVSVAEAEAYVNAGKVKGDPNNASKIGSILYDTESTPGKTNETQTTLQVGTYLLLIAPEQGEPKIRANFVVGAAKAPVALPAPQATIRSIEFGFRGPSTLHDGELVRFENEGFLVHMNLAFPVKNAADAKQAIKLLLAGKEKPVRKLIIGAPLTFAGPLSPGALQQETITAKPGVYVEVCFMDTQDGREHTQLGMERMIKITK
jgi:hypothetical protein